jgi:hypothetical protein
VASFLMCEGRNLTISWFDKFAGSKFEHAKYGPKGGGQDARSNPSLSAIFQQVTVILIGSYRASFRYLGQFWVSSLRFCHLMLPILECSSTP